MVLGPFIIICFALAELYYANCETNSMTNETVKKDHEHPWYMLDAIQNAFDVGENLFPLLIISHVNCEIASSTQFSRSSLSS